MNVHKKMWLALHEEIEKLMKKDMARCPMPACHEIQALMNKIEEDHRGHIELRGSDENLCTYIAVDNLGGMKK